jgi:hypothetical protein
MFLIQTPGGARVEAVTEFGRKDMPAELSGIAAYISREHFAFVQGADSAEIHHKGGAFGRIGDQGPNLHKGSVVPVKVDDRYFPVAQFGQFYFDVCEEIVIEDEEAPAVKEEEKSLDPIIVGMAADPVPDIMEEAPPTTPGPARVRRGGGRRVRFVETKPLPTEEEMRAFVENDISGMAAKKKVTPVVKAAGTVALTMFPTAYKSRIDDDLLERIPLLDKMMKEKISTNAMRMKETTSEEHEATNKQFGFGKDTARSGQLPWYHHWKTYESVRAGRSPCSC